MSTPVPGPLHVACLCAAWCHLCADYAPLFLQVVDRLRQQHPSLQAHWIDIEDEADLLGDYDVETFPTIVVADEARVRFAGPLTPQAQTLLRLLRATLDDDSRATDRVEQTPELEAFARRLRRWPHTGA